MLVIMAAFVLMGMCQFAHNVDNVEGRLEYMGAIVLTCAAYKLSISTNIPAIAYLTLLDVYVETEGEGGGATAIRGTLCSRRVRGRDRRRPFVFDPKSGQFDQAAQRVSEQQQ